MQEDSVFVHTLMHINGQSTTDFSVQTNIGASIEEYKLAAIEYLENVSAFVVDRSRPISVYVKIGSKRKPKGGSLPTDTIQLVSDLFNLGENDPHYDLTVTIELFAI